MVLPDFTAKSKNDDILTWPRFLGRAAADGSTLGAGGLAYGLARTSGDSGLSGGGVVAITAVLFVGGFLASFVHQIRPAFRRELRLDPRSLAAFLLQLALIVAVGIVAGLNA